MTDNDLYWLAGLLEGEGCFMSHETRAYPYWSVAVNMTDGDVLTRAASVIGGAVKLGGPYTTEGKPWKPQYRLALRRRAEVKALLLALLPIMGERRRARIGEMLAEMEARPPRATWRHGTRHGYMRGCRCDACRAAHATHHRRRRAARARQ